MIGRRISHYLIERSLGAGGMGDVYLAKDLALGRMCALKLLPPGRGEAHRSRMVWEAQAGARLQHPGIATFYEAGDEEGTTFIAMEYVEGETLRSRMARSPIPPAEALAWTACVLEALAHAHAVGLLHRDVKPENIMVTGERSAKLLDFGLAKAWLGDGSDEAPTSPQLTMAGAVAGTIGYMSPEQVQGQALDARSDLFSVGAVLHEAITGLPAFPGRTAAERLMAIVSKDPAPVTSQGVPAGLPGILRRAMARDPRQRYQAASAFLADLRSVASGETVTALPETLAVLDLRNLSGNPDDEWVGSGIAESLGVDLARVPGLTVLAREKVLGAAAAARAGGREPDAIETGLVLGCRWVLSGGFQRMGPALRVTARLSEVSTGHVVIAEKLDGTAEGIFEMQDRLSASVADALDLRQDAAGGGTAAPRLGAWEHYARGRRMWVRLERGSFDLARGMYEKAVAEDPGYAPALAGLAAVHAMRFTFTTDFRELDQAEDFARRAIQADPRLDEPHIWLGYALMRQRRPEDALASFGTAIRLGGSNAFAPYFIGCTLTFSGSREEAVARFQHALEIDPRHGWSWLGLGWAHLDLGRIDEAIWSLGKAVALEGDAAEGPTAGSGGYLGECLRRAGRLDDARARCLEGIAAAERSDHMYRDSFRGVGLCALGRTTIQQDDRPASVAAFSQAVSHLKGRPRALGGGQLLVQALAGLARAGEGPDPYEEAMRLFARRDGFDFSDLWVCSDDVTLLELARAAGALGRNREAADLRGRAVEAGSAEAASDD